MLQLPFFKKKNNKTNKFLTLNFNSEEIRCLAFYFDGTSYRIIGSGLSQLKEGTVRNGYIINQGQLENNIDIAVTQATADLEETVDNIVVGLEGELCFEQTTTVRYKRPDSTPIGNKEVEKLYSRIEQAAFFQAENQVLKLTGNPDIEIKNITSADVFINIDGQKTEEILGKEGKQIEIAVYNAYTPDFQLNALNEAVGHNKLSLLAAVSQNYAVTQWMLQEYPEKKDFILLDMSQDKTSVSVVFSGGIVNTNSIGLGLKHFVEGLSQKMGLTLEEAQKVLKMYMIDKLSQSEMSVVASCIEETLNIWLHALKLLFEEFTGIKTFPSLIYTQGAGVELNDIMKALENTKWTRSIPFKEVPEIKKINFSKLSRIMDSTGKVNSQDWLKSGALSIIFEEII